MEVLPETAVKTKLRYLGNVCFRRGRCRAKRQCQERDCPLHSAILCFANIPIPVRIIHGHGTPSVGTRPSAGPSTLTTRLHTSKDLCRWASSRLASESSQTVVPQRSNVGSDQQLGLCAVTPVDAAAGPGRCAVARWDGRKHYIG